MNKHLFKKKKIQSPLLFQPRRLFETQDYAGDKTAL